MCVSIDKKFHDEILRSVGKPDRNLKVAVNCSEPYAEPRGVDMATEAKITYVTLTADNQELNAKFDAAISQVKGVLGADRKVTDTTKSQ